MPRPLPRWTLRPLALACATVLAPAARAQTAPTVLPPVEVIATTPVPGTGVPRDQIPANVQTGDAKRLREVQSLNLPDFLSSQIGSVTVNEIQGNPYQLDVNFRGFTASPLLGTPQGLSVFQDGVRVNEPFGDVVNWDLIPKAALASLVLLPGSNPLFGLNTLGGALSLQTKSGDTHPGTEFELQAGSFGRISGEATHGRRLGEHGHLFLAASAFNEDGWRDHSPSRVRQFFAKAGEHGGGFDWEVALTYGRNRLIGNGLLPESMLAVRREQVYTRPDQTQNELAMLSLNMGWDVSARQRISGTVYLRRSDANTLNGDLNDDYDPPTVTETGVENRTATEQRSGGFALQSTWTGTMHRVTLGASYDQARNNFVQTEAEGRLDDTRAVVPEDDPEVDAKISGKTRTASLYLQDVIALAPNLQLTLAGRYNDTRVSTVDEGRIELGLPTTLDGEGTYRKFNPAAGLTWQVTPGFTAYGNLSQGSRAPSPIELGCSDPANACVLPNALQSDPPLEQVVSRTAEFGVRGSLAVAGAPLRWNATVFHTDNKDDLLFISNGLAAGYFTNFGRTRRQGVELGLAQRAGAFNWSAAYSWLRATFESGACLVAEGNSTAETSPACPGEGEIEVRPGNRLPGLPEHSFKLGADWQATPSWNIGAQMRAYSSQFARGNENNAHQADGVEYFGSGRIGGYALLDLTTSWRFAKQFELFGRISNVFDRRYASSGMLGENAFDPASGALLAPDDWRAEQFVGPGAPRAAWVGVRVQF